jgi:hypothetical protein
VVLRVPVVLRAVDFLRPVVLRAALLRPEALPALRAAAVRVAAVDFLRPVVLRAVDFLRPVVLRVPVDLRAVDLLRPVVFRVPVVVRAVLLRARVVLPVPVERELDRLRPVVFFSAKAHLHFVDSTRDLLVCLPSSYRMRVEQTHIHGLLGTI